MFEGTVRRLVAALATHGVSTDERLKRLETLDLTNVRRKLQEPYPEGKNWTPSQALEAEKWYKRYLATIIKYPEATKHIPNGPIDFFWHQHILDTMRYGEDCQHVLGYFLHHYPYYGLNGDAAERDGSFDETNAIYRHMFGEDCTAMTGFNTETRERQGSAAELASGCGGGGSGTGCGQGCSRRSAPENVAGHELVGSSGS